jgi:adenylate cyclase
VTIRTQTLLIVTVLLVAAVLATAGVLGWRARQAVLAETEAQGLVIARLLSRGAAFGAGVMNDVEAAIGEQMVVEAKMAAHLVAVGEAAGLSTEEINRRLKQIADDTVLDEIWITDEKGHAYLRNIADVDFTFSPDPAGARVGVNSALSQDRAEVLADWRSSAIILRAFNQNLAEFGQRQ